MIQAYVFFNWWMILGLLKTQKKANPSILQKLNAFILNYGLKFGAMKSTFGRKHKNLIALN